MTVLIGSFAGLVATAAAIGMAYAVVFWQFGRDCCPHGESV